MSISRSPKSPQHTYTKASNSFIYDCRLSLKSKALLLFVLSKPDTWIFNYRDVLRFNSDGIKSVRNSIRELTSFGYLIIFQSHRPNGDFDYSQYMFFETTQNLNTTKTDTPAHSPFGHALKAYAPAAHALNPLTPNNKIKKLLREETTSSSTMLVNTNVPVDVSPISEKKKETISLLNSFGVLSQKKIFARFDLNLINTYIKWLISKNYDINNPTGYLWKALSEKWIIGDVMKQNKKVEGYFYYRCEGCKLIFGYASVIPEYKLCNACSGRHD